MEIAKQNTLRIVIFGSISALCLLPLVTTPMALAAGLLFGLTFGCPAHEHVARFTKYLLQICVVGLGFGMPLVEVISAGKDGLWVSFMTIVLAAGIGALITRALHVKNNTSALIIVGTAICGGSAIAAVAPIIKADSEEISVSLGAIFILNALALFFFPYLGHLLNLSPEQFGLWAALAIHDTSSVVGASSLFGEHALAIATTVKLSRALWILPLSIFFAFVMRTREKITIPWFIVFFIGAALCNSLLPELRFFTLLSATSKQAMCVVLFWIGCSINSKNIRRVGWQPFGLAVLLWLTLASSSLVYVCQ